MWGKAEQIISVYLAKAMVNSGNDSRRDEWVVGFFKVTEKSPQSVCLSDWAAGSRESRDKRSTSIPARICARMFCDTGGGSIATALDGMGICIAVEESTGF